MEQRMLDRRTFTKLLAAAGAAGALGLGGLGSLDARALAAEAATEDPDATAASCGIDDRQAISGDLRLSVWGSDAEIQTDQSVIDAFMEVYPNCHAELEVINDAYLTKVETEMVAGAAPDVIYGHPKYFQKWASQDMLLDLTDYFDKAPALTDPEHYATDLYDAFTYQGRYYSTINGADTFLLYYNKDLFDEAGVAYPTDDWTWDDFLAACQALTKDTDGDGEVDQYAITGSWSHEQIEAFMAAFGGEIYDDVNNPTEVTVTSNEGNRKGLQMIYDLTYTYNYSPDAEQSEMMSGSFDQGKIAMNVDGVYDIVYRSATDGGVDFPYGIAHLPYEGDNAHAVALMAGYCVPASCPNPEAAWALASFMESVRGQTLLAETGLITVINKDVASSDAVIDIPNAPDNHILRVTTLEGAVNVDAKLPNWQETLDTAWQPVIDQLYNQELSVDEALDALQENLTEMLGRD